MKFDWLANRVEKLGELQRQASVETISASDQMIATPGGSRVKESDMIASARSKPSPPNSTP